MKICELQIKDIASVKAISESLLINGYTVTSTAIYRPFPRDSSIDCFLVEISKTDK